MSDMTHLHEKPSLGLVFGALSARLGAPSATPDSPVPACALLERPMTNRPRPAPSRADHRPSGLRTAAHAASRAVRDGGPAAFDAGFDLYESEIASLRATLHRQQEALKVLGIYGVEDWARKVARWALTGEEAPLTAALPIHLHDPALAEKARA